MVSSGSWRDHFKIDDNILKAFWEEFSESSPLRASEFTLETAQSTTEFVLWCVRERHFTEQSFIEYQSELLNMPAIRQEFFATPIDEAFWERVKDLHPWTASCFPLSEWEGHLLIASVWPDESLKLSIPHSFALGTPTGLREFYARYQAIEAFKIPVDVAIEAPISAEAPQVDEPPVVVAPPVVAPPAKKSAPAPIFDDGDPFAALSRELGLLNGAASSEATSEEAAPEAEAPEGFVIPDGLKFSTEEVSRLGLSQVSEADATPTAESSDTTFENNEAPEGLSTFTASSIETPEVQPEVAEGGTLLHNFETGSHEVVARKAPPNLSEPAAQGEPAQSIFAPMALEAPVSETVPEAILEIDLDVTQPSIVVHEAAPVMPFAPIVTPSSPAMVRPPLPPAPPAIKITEAVPPTAKAFEPESPARPVAEATIVVSAVNSEPETAPKVRKPLFEPAAGDSALPKTAIADRMKEMAAQRGGTQSSTQSGTQTGTKSKKLEAPPLTSFFSRDSLKQSGRVRNDAYANHTISISKIEPIHLDQCSSIDEAGAQALLQASNLFETAMILLFKDGELQPWKWSDLFLSINGEKPAPVELKDPSIFKVVFRTAKPYHGYVVTSTTNQKFFNEFYRGMLPKHATVIPIMIDGRMGGMLLAFTNSKIDYRQSLRLMERLSFDLSRVFKMLRGTMSKAG